jgi:hypothetical protein
MSAQVARSALSISRMVTSIGADYTGVSGLGTAFGEMRSSMGRECQVALPLLTLGRV